MIALDRPLVLGSASPRRQQLLAGLGIPIRVVPGNVEEANRPGEPPDAYLSRVVADFTEHEHEEKLEAGVSKLLPTSWPRWQPSSTVARISLGCWWPTPLW